jgi:hypothetical protein
LAVDNRLAQQVLLVEATETQPRNNTHAHMRSQDTQNNDDLSPGLGLGLGLGQNSGSLGKQDSNSGLNPHFAPFQGTAVSGTGSQDSGIETIENPYSRANKRRMMPRPPTQSGVQNENHLQSVGSAHPPQRPNTGPAASRPPLNNASSPLFN